jgi:predicted dinucleotide-binding enzyme
MDHPKRLATLSRMKIGIIGTGNMGRALGVAWARRGHQVRFGSRDLAKARGVAAEAGASASAGSTDDAAAFGDVVLYTLRDVPPTRLLSTPTVLDGKVLIDCNNSDFSDVATCSFPRPYPSIAERLAADVPRARVVKAFNTHPAQVLVLGREVLAAQRISAFVCGDDAEARAQVCELANDLGLVPVDSGGLVRASLVEGLADFLRFQIIAMGRGGYATLNLAIARTEQESSHV